MNAIVAFAIGDRYLKNFNRTFRPCMERYAEKIGVESFVITEHIRPSKHSIWWQKLLLFSHPPLARYDKLLIIDSDIYMTKHAEDIFTAAGDHEWAICKNNPYGIPERDETDKLSYLSTPKVNEPPFAFNCGVRVNSRSQKDGLEKVYDDYVGVEARDYDTGPVSYFLYNNGDGIILDSKFNTLVADWVKQNSCSLSSVLRMYEQASFLHFAANKWYSIFLFVKWLDTRKTDTAIRFLRLFARPSLDAFTAVLFRLFQRIVGSYLYKKKLLLACFRR